ncbi:NAD(P)-binding protein [Fistulina hepatica ATCC 64428]|uniref:D-xylose 1-dehydrogenase (NADP(+), D-xylono-1,5-lactone-forming) n=1 Tax=Fistulina hepatica ATCC 64428 TaxID=1128425 RepID=A0A0D7ANG5_9AGAR|nr:NAD(P)-binding protein [Fistulina hepatica ATCC 64428]
MFVLRWGVISTGHIAAKFVRDIVLDPKTRNVHDVEHAVTAVGSRSVANAREFIRECAGGDPSIKAYGSYDEVFNDPNVDAVYIGTPHPLHYPNALAAIKAKKHVLCEKPITISENRLKSLIAASKAHEVFLMEAMWTRFLPLSLEIKKIVDSGELGLPCILQADLSWDCNVKSLPSDHRLISPNHAGGPLLDLGPYPLVWAIMILFEHPQNNAMPPSSIVGSMVKTYTGVDNTTSFVLNFENSPNAFAAQAQLSCSQTAGTIDPGVIVRFEKGVMKIFAPIYCPQSCTIERLGPTGEPDAELITTTIKSVDFEGGGWHFQADEVARCIRDGKLESGLWSHEKSLLEMRVFDEVRRQGGYVFPPGLDKRSD